MRKFILLVMVLTLIIISTSIPCADTPMSEAPTEETEVQPTKILPTEVVIPEPSEIPTEVVNPWTDEEVIVLAQMLYGECRGVKSITEQAACVWCVLNRCDTYGQSVIEVVTAPRQFHGYDPNNPVWDNLVALSEDVLSRWHREKNGEESVGRVLPADYLWFTGDGWRNHFRNEYKGGEVWDWSLPSPYES